MIFSRSRRLLLGAAGALALPALARSQTAAPAGGTVVFELKDGPVTIQLLPEFAPRHVERIRALVERGFYDNTPFHRVIEGFMAQGGDKTGTGMGGSEQTGLPDVPAEFVPASRARFLRGTCGMARSQQPNSANSQFFIMFAPAPFLDGQYTIWGRVTAGMEAVDKIKRGIGQGGQVPAPADRLIRARLGA